MIIDYVAEKNNLISVSGGQLSGDLADTTYNVRKSFSWSVPTAQEHWLKLNVLEPLFLQKVELEFTGIADVKIERSVDNLVWKELLPTSGVYDGYSGEFIFIRISIKNSVDFVLTAFRVYGDVIINIKPPLSLVAGNFFPQSFYQNFPVLPDFITQFLSMLDANPVKENEYFEPKFTADINVIEVETVTEGDITLEANITGVIGADVLYIWDFGDNENLNNSETTNAMVLKNDNTPIYHIYPDATKDYLCRLIIRTKKADVEITKLLSPRTIVIS